jgi:hypothetical protein
MKIASLLERRTCIHYDETTCERCVRGGMEGGWSATLRNMLSQDPPDAPKAESLFRREVRFVFLHLG